MPRSSLAFLLLALTAAWIGRSAVGGVAAIAWSLMAAFLLAAWIGFLVARGRLQRS